MLNPLHRSLACLLICGLTLPAYAAADLVAPGLRILEQGAHHTLIEVEPGAAGLYTDKDGRTQVELAEWPTHASHGEYLLPTRAEFWEVPPSGPVRVVVDELETEWLPDRLPALGVDQGEGEIVPGPAALAGSGRERALHGPLRRAPAAGRTGDPAGSADLPAEHPAGGGPGGGPAGADPGGDPP